MKHFLLYVTLLVASTSFSQGMGDVTVFSNTGDQFYVVLNGIRQNNRPETNVKVTGLVNEWYSCKIISANNNFNIEKNIMVKYDTLVTYQIINKKGKYKMRYFSESSLGTTTSVPDQTVVTYHATEEPLQSTDGSSNAQVNVGNSNSTVGTTTTTTTTTTTSSNENISTSTGVNNGGNTETIDMNINISENGMGANVNINTSGMEGENMNASMNTTGSTTTTTTSSSDLGGTTYYEETTTTTSSNNGNTYYEETTTVTTTTTSSSNDNVLYQDSDMTATIEPVESCYTSDQEVDQLVKQIENEAFSDDQQRVANLAAKNKCMSSAQIKRVAESFTFSENQLSFMKAAYDNCTDKSNYYQLMDVLTFSSDKEELEKFINSK